MPQEDYQTLKLNREQSKLDSLGDSVCLFLNCDSEKHFSRGFCPKHYQRVKKEREKHGDFWVTRVKRLCEVYECGRPHMGYGFCATHLRRFKSGADLEEPIHTPARPTSPYCSFNPCSRRQKAKGYCLSHYRQEQNGKELTAIKKTIHNVGDLWVNENGYVETLLYEHTYMGTGRALEHRVVMSEVLERRLRKHENVHHKNGIRTDNRIENLELWSTYQPSGQRVSDKIDWYMEYILQYVSEYPDKIRVFKEKL